VRAKKGQEAIQLDFGYLEEAQRKWLCQHSRILAFETNDPKRHKQIKAFFIARFPDAEVYLYNRWKGLTRWNKAQAAFLSVTHGASGAYDALIANAVEQQYRDLVEALRYLDERLRRTQTVVILEDLEFSREDFKEPLLDALRDWAHDPILIANHSVVVLVSADLSRVVDELTLDRIVLVRPPLSTEAERREVVTKVAQKLGNTPRSSHKGASRARYLWPQPSPIGVRAPRVLGGNPRLLCGPSEEVQGGGDQPCGVPGAGGATVWFRGHWRLPAR